MSCINGKKIRELRHEKKLSQFGLALEINVSRRTIENIEYGHGTCNGVSSETIKKLADYFGVKIDDLFNQTQSSPFL